MNKDIQIDMGMKITIIVYAIFVLSQILILCKKFKFKNLLQVLFSFAFGFFIDSTSTLLNWINTNNYFLQLLLMIISLMVTAIGATLFITMDIVPNSPEGLMLAICEITGVSFHKMKILCDCICVILGVVLSLLFLGNISSIREGTIISALLTGKLMGVFPKHCNLWLKKVAFYI